MDQKARGILHVPSFIPLKDSLRGRDMEMLNVKSRYVTEIAMFSI